MESFVHDQGFEAPEIEELQPLFPGFVIEGFLAQGGMGALYVARQKSLDRPVAIKILPREFGADPQFRASFESEAKTMARLNHPNLIGVYDFGEAAGYLYIILELVDGESLFEAAHGRVVDPLEAARLVAEICRGLADAHRNGILHRDIKPANVLLAPGPQPKIVDFGLARPAGQGHEEGEVIYGTPEYSAPEVVENPAAVDQRADIFSVGVVLYELLTGQLPGASWHRPSALVSCDPGFDEITGRAAHPSPAMRYAGADEMADELEALAAKLEGPMGRLLPGAPQAGAGRTAPAGVARPGLSPAKAGGGATLLVAGLVVALLAAGAFVVVKGMRNEPPNADQSPPVAPGATPPATSDPEPSDALANASVPPGEMDAPPEPSVDALPPEPPEDPPESPAESPAESLARLQAQLQSGARDEMPLGAVRRGETWFLLVDEPLGWREASLVAERHGAQLAVFESPEDVQWAERQFNLEFPVWLGLSDSGTEGKWHWVTGPAVAEGLWAPGQPDNTAGRDDGEDFAALLPGAILDDLPGTNPLRFMLEWSSTGDPPGPPGSLASQLKRCGEALREKQAPVFPAGSRNIGGSRFLLVPGAISWERASATAKAAGGHLAVPSTEAEAAWIAELLRHTLEDGEGAWTGGVRRAASSPWGFVTGELFDFVTWAPGRPDGPDDAPAFLQFRRAGGEGGGLGYDDTVADDPEVVCLVIEWSAPSRRNMPGKGEDGAPPANAAEWLLAHQERTAEQQRSDYKPFRQRWDKNVKDFISDVEDKSDSFGRGRFGGGRKRMAQNYTREIREAGRIPDSVPGFAERLLGDLHRDALDKQNELWTGYEPKFQEALDRYLEEIGPVAARLERFGKRDEAEYLAREITATTAEHTRFHDILNGIHPPVPEG